MVAAILLAVLAGVVVGSLADSQPAGAFTFGAVLVAAWVGFMARTGLRLTNAQGDVFRFHPLYVAGVAVVLAAGAAFLAPFPGIGLVGFLVGAILIVKGRRRSGVIGRPEA